ncbi:Helix-turn-helix domain-containing protein [Pseudooceanicola antarcticus]|uniref:Helix-turn-helix domain-containing protein n=1 Tax=Pseudooceanicola antarcticus TaxID=1247613 RepID=A0A285ILW3_9RHOB|nr:helix-turn-helix domain-containing protein [Pseudooceanicola antarcticus]PJE28861.1 hypothetical protein CVM39_10395 [Pseudooceanicola antarcticus]SNY47961.1 Helix-turn-helix domain-containing protein [Pseudooceanicola antarcticus]
MAKRDKRGNAASFIKLDTWIFDRPAYRRLGPGARSLHWELIRVFNGHNNGRLFLSQRLAAERLGCSRNTVSRYYRELEEAGFITKTRGACLGPEGVGQAAHWALTHLGVDGRPATLDFKSRTPA